MTSSQPIRFPLPLLAALTGFVALLLVGVGCCDPTADEDDPSLTEAATAAESELPWCCTCAERPDEDVLSWTCKDDSEFGYYVCFVDMCEPV